MPKKYERSPIVEAVCAVVFDPSSPWDLAIPGILYGKPKIKQIFPKRGQTRQLEIATTARPEGIEQQVQQIDRAQFLSKDGLSVLQVGQHLLSIHRLQPYLSWEHFLPMIMLGVNTYLREASPIGISHLSLRYINEIAIPGPLVQLEDYFDFYPKVGDRLPQSHGPFLVGMQLLFDELPGVLQVQLATSANSREDNLVFSLELICISSSPFDAAEKPVREWLEIAHRHIEEVFEGAIKDPLRERLGLVKVG